MSNLNNILYTCSNASRTEMNLLRLNNQITALNKKIGQLYGTKFIQGKLCADDLPEEQDKLTREFVAKTYNTLKETNQLNLIGNPALFEYQGDRNFNTCCEVIKTLAADYMNQQPRYSFLQVTDHLEFLSNGDLIEYKLKYLNAELKIAQSDRTALEDIVKSNKTNLERLKFLSNKKAADFKEGDFSFISDDWSLNKIKKLYDVVQKNGTSAKWKEAASQFNLDDCDLVDECVNRGLSKDMQEANEGDCFSSFLAKELLTLYAFGWDSFVESHLKEQKELLAKILGARV